MEINDVYNGENLILPTWFLLISLSRNNEFATAEDIAENFAAICNFEKSTHPTALADSLSAMISASTSNKSEKVSDKPLANKIDTVVEVITENTTNGSTPLTVKCKSEDLFSDIQQYFSEHPDR